MLLPVGRAQTAPRLIYPTIDGSQGMVARRVCVCPSASRRDRGAVFHRTKRYYDAPTVTL